MVSFHPVAPANRPPRPSLCHVNRATLDPPLFFSPWGESTTRRIIKLPRAATPVQIARNEIPSGTRTAAPRFPPTRMPDPGREFASVSRSLSLVRYGTGRWFHSTERNYAHSKITGRHSCHFVAIRCEKHICVNLMLPQKKTIQKRNSKEVKYLDNVIYLRSVDNLGDVFSHTYVNDREKASLDIFYLEWGKT